MLCRVIINLKNPSSMKLTELNEELCEPWEYKGSVMKLGPDCRITPKHGQHVTRPLRSGNCMLYFPTR